MIIAVDGSAASGKGTLAKRLAAHYDLAHLDTGALYRCLALHLITEGRTATNVTESEAAGAVGSIDLLMAGSAAIRTDAVAGMASVVAAMPAVRQNFVSLQRQFATQTPNRRGAVLDGRDIGSVILPDADFKFFIDADLEERARRRTKELQESGQSAMFRDVFEDMQDRDRRDRERSTAPLKAAEDALVIDTTQLDADSVFAMAASHIDGNTNPK
ncbi:MAG: (d)CMP kinase [Pseudomonadota bacterium]|nr:(d)CMP kinase [Pseudomonadota bacterium]MEC7485314.1 (d)CMP kinase [Pseudomonadota bacterium]MEC8516109.1 (d)CMP kinase [Pseudomonadota bacterium]MEC8806724.1 (d)CMP kinase [Pseudomonadota bacterium]MEE3025920.1 (d)CMP kinase [Pseudomonadota bacterium]